MAQWEKVYMSSSLAEASIIQGMLEENHVPVQVMNKLDSSYLSFGEIEIYVPEHLLITARQLISQQLSN